MSVVFYPFFIRAQISLPNERMGRASALYNSIVENIGNKVRLKVCCLEFPVF